MNRKRSKTRSEIWISVLSPLVLALAWEMAASAGVIKVAFFPPPSKLVMHGWQVLKSGELWPHTWATVQRLWWAFILASVPGVGAGLLMGLSRPIRVALDPTFSLIYPIPCVLFLPLVSIILGPGDLAVVVTSSVTSFFIVAVNTMTGVVRMDRVLLEAARNFGCRGWRLFYKVLLPGAMPMTFTGLRIGLGFALIVVIALELVGTNQGLGSYLWLSWTIMQIPDVYVSLGAIAILGLLTTYGLEAVASLVMPWRQELNIGGRG